MMNRVSTSSWPAVAGGLALTGHGLLLWLGLSVALLQSRGSNADSLRALQSLAGSLGLLLTLAAWPLVWRLPPALPQPAAGPRRWLARTATSSVALLAIALVAQLRLGQADPGWLAVTGLLLAIAGGVSAVAVALLSAPADDPMQPPIGLALALLGGAGLLFALIAEQWPGGQSLATGPAPSLLLLLLVAGLLKLLQWRERGGLLPLAAWRPRRWVLSLLLAVPLLAVMATARWPSLAPFGWWLAALSLLAGIVAERVAGSRITAVPIGQAAE